jgi:hypothetical protein
VKHGARKRKTSKAALPPGTKRFPEIRESRATSALRMIRQVLIKAAPYCVICFFVSLFYGRILFLRDQFIPWDLPDYHLPHAYLISKALQNWHLPFWDPSTFCGRPIYAEIQAQVFYPFRLVTAILAGPESHLRLFRAMEMELIFHVLLAGIFCLWLARAVGLIGAQSLFCACAYSLGCYFASQAEHIGAIEGAAWLPLAWLGVVHMAKGRILKGFLLSVLSFSLIILSGFTPGAIPIFLSAGVLAVLLVSFREARARLLACLAAAIVMAAWLVAFQLIPTQELAKLSLANMRTVWRGTGGGIPLHVLWSLINPNALGVFSWSTFNRSQEITLSYLYCGIVTLVCAGAAILFRPSKMKVVIVIAVAVACICMLGDSTPVGAAIFLMLPSPIRASIYPQHWMAPFCLSISLLAGFGLATFPRLGRWGYLLVFIGALDLVRAGSSRPMNSMVFWPDSIGLDTGIDGESEILGKLRLDDAGYRPPYRIDLYQDEAGVWAAEAPLTGIPTANGLDPLALIRSLRVRAKLSGDALWAYAPIAHLDPMSLSMMSVRYIVAHRPIEADTLSASGLQLKWSTNQSYVYENSNVLPRFVFVSKVARASDLNASLLYMKRPDWNPGEEAVVESEDIPGSFTKGAVTVVNYSDDNVTLHASVSGVGFLTTSETHYPGWRAWIDGVETTIYFTNGAFRGIIVPAGEHNIVFRFRPTIFYYSAMLSLLGGATLLTLCLLSRTKVGTFSMRFNLTWRPAER